MRKARKQWVKMLQILGQEGANMRVSGVFYKAVIQARLIYG